MLRFLVTTVFTAALILPSEWAIAQQTKPKKCIDYRAACFKKCEARGGRSCAVVCNTRPTC
jgi:hypothetical protein